MLLIEIRAPGIFNLNVFWLYFRFSQNGLDETQIEVIWMKKIGTMNII